MSSFLKRALWMLVCVVTALPASAQLLPSQLGKSATNTATETSQDPLGRDTPSGTLFGFLQAAQAGNNSTAAEYLQMSAAKRQTQGEQLSLKLKTVMDRAFSGNLTRVSNQPEGTPQEGVPLDRQRIGVLAAGDTEADFTLVHVTDPSGARIWLISADTLAKIPELYDQAQVHQVENHLPRVLVQHQFLGMPFWQWLAILLAIPTAGVLGFALVQILRLPWHFWTRSQPGVSVTLRPRITNPLWLVLSTIIHNILVSYFRLPLLQRHYYQQTAGVVLVIASNWLLWRILQWLLRRLRERAILAEHMGTGSLMLLGERLLKAAVFIIAVFAILGTLGFNMSTALAGLGIGGIAVAFAAQKTLENLFGGVSVMGDEVILVGETCRFGNRVGTVEDISLRSTRIRTPERTVLSIPNGSLATMNIENLSRRDKILFNAKLGLRYETSPDQLRYVLAQIRRLLYAHPKVETDGARVRLVGFDDSTLSAEIFCYVLTRDFAEFLAIREDLLLRIMEIVNSSGSGFAFPSQTLYLGRDSGLDKEKTESAHREVQQWRESGNLPFPDFAADDVSQFSNSLPYPQPESAVRRQK